ncbi:MAG: SDR family NAD(P)-dependent oxidoreductase [Candidatus Heimdallarchaeaceae archaeon]|jgi:NAD(P)-dependent dehydrogenase (short-subunit alcohol dehydrogenase family)
MPKIQKCVLITGAAHGIGKSITEYLAEKGEIVYAADVDSEALNNIAQSKNIIPIEMDVTNVESIQKAAEKVNSQTEYLDILINNAGVFTGGPLVELDFHNLERIIDVNVLGYFRVTKLLFPLLKKQKGTIINISSEVGRIAFPFNGPYSMSKYAVEAFSDSLRRELAFLDMKVVVLQPGGIRTKLTKESETLYYEIAETSEFQAIIQKLLPILEKQRYYEPRLIAKKVYKIIHKSKPKHRYRIKNNKLRRFLEFLPVRLTDFFILNFM